MCVGGFCGHVLCVRRHDWQTAAARGGQGYLLRVLGAVFYASSTLLNKKMPPVDSITKTIYQFTLAAVVLLPYVLLKHDICPYA